MEITANEVIKYEICKKTAALSSQATKGDGDPLDICILSELPIEKSDIIMDVRIIGGIRLIDSNEVDDKLIAVLNGDPYFKNAQDIKDINPVVIDRIKHYFLTYKTLPHEPTKTIIENVYGAEEAYKVVMAGQADYRAHFL